ARIMLLDVTNRVMEVDDEIRAVALLRRGLVEKSAGRYTDALEIYKQAASLTEKLDNNSLKGRLHNSLGTLLNRLALAESSEDKLDQALIEFTAASFYFEQAGHQRYGARVENNLGFLFGTIKKFDEAHQHLNRARRLF